MQFGSNVMKSHIGEKLNMVDQCMGAEKLETYDTFITVPEVRLEAGRQL